MTEQKIAIKVHKPDLKEKTFYLLSGLLISVPMTVFFSVFTNNLLTTVPPLRAQLCAAVLMGPAVEEFSKVFPLYYRHGETEKSIFTLGLLVGLGFGITEFFVSVFAQGQSPIARLPGIIFHPCSASISAYGIAKKHPIPFLATAVTLHAASNLFAFFSNLWFIGGPSVFLATYLIAYYLYRRTSNKPVKQATSYSNAQIA
jgi:hypothetical protein